jgi:hypothetical protein
MGDLDLDQVETEQPQKLFRSSNEFSLYIEMMVQEHKISHMDAVLKYCEDNMLEPQDVSSKINKSLKDKIELNMQELNYLPKHAQLEL